MLRAAVVSIVLTLAMGQNAALLCQAWCDPHATAATECHYDDATLPRLTGSDHCTDCTFGVTAFVGEDARRGASVPDAPHAVVVTGFRFAPPPTDIRSGHDLGQQSLLAARPPVIALRI